VQPFILVVDDDPQVADLISESLESEGFRVTLCHDAVQTLIQAEGMNIGLLVLDIMMGSFGSGIEAYKNIRSNNNLPKDLPVVFLTGMKPAEAQRLVPKDDPRVRLLHKPTTMPKLLGAITALTGDRLKSKAAGAGRNDQTGG